MSDPKSQEIAENNSNHEDDDLNFADLVSNILMTTGDQENKNGEDDHKDSDEAYVEEEENDDDCEKSSFENEKELREIKDSYNEDPSIEAENMNDNGDHDSIKHINQILKNNPGGNLNRRDSAIGDVNNQEWLKLLQNDIRRGSVSFNNINSTASKRKQSIGGNDVDDAFLTNAILQSLKNMNTEENDQNQNAVSEDESLEQKEDNAQAIVEPEIDSMKLVDDVLQDILMQGTSDEQASQTATRPPTTAVTAEKPPKKQKAPKKKKKIASQDDDLQALINQVVSNTLQEHAQLGTKQKPKLSSTVDQQQQQLSGLKKKKTSASSKKKKNKADDLDIVKIMKDAMHLAKSKQPDGSQEQEGESAVFEEPTENEFNFDDLGLNLDQIIENTMQPIILQEQASRHQLLQQQQLQVQQRLQAIAKQKILEKKKQKEEARAARKIRREEKQKHLEEEKKNKKLAKLEKKKAKEENLEHEKVKRLERRQQKKEMKEQQRTLKIIEKENKRKIKEAEKLARQLRRDQKRQLKEKKLAAQQQAAASGLKPTNFITQKLKTDDSKTQTIPAYKARLAQLRKKDNSVTPESSTGTNTESKEQILTPTSALLQKYNLPPIPTTDELGSPLTAKQMKKAEQKALRHLQKERVKEIQRKERDRTRELRRLQKEELKRFRLEERNRRLAYFKQMKKEQEQETGITTGEVDDEIVPGVTEDAVRRAISLNLKPNKSLTSIKRKRDEEGEMYGNKKQKLSKKDKEAKKKAKLLKEENRRLRKEKKKNNLPGLNVIKIGFNPSSDSNLVKNASDTHTSSIDNNSADRDKDSSLMNLIKTESASDLDNDSASDSELDSDDAEYAKKKKAKTSKSKNKIAVEMQPDLSLLSSPSAVISKNSLRLIPVVLKGPPFPWYLRVNKMGIPKLPLAKNNTKSSLIRKRLFEVKKEIDLNGRDIALWEEFKRMNPFDFNEKYDSSIKEIQNALLKKFGKDVTIDLDLGIIENGEFFELYNDKAHPPFVIPEIPVFTFGQSIINTAKFGNISKNWLQTLDDDTKIAEILGNNMNLIKNLRVTWFNKELSHQMKIRKIQLSKERAKEEALQAESEKTRDQLKEQRKIRLVNSTLSPHGMVMSVNKHSKKENNLPKKPSKSLHLLMNTPPSLPLNMNPPSEFTNIKATLSNNLDTELAKIKDLYNKMDINAMTSFLSIIKSYYILQLQWISKFQPIQVMRRYVGKVAKNYHKQFEVEKQVLNLKGKLKGEALEFFNDTVGLTDDVVISFLKGLIEEKQKIHQEKNMEVEDNLKRVNKELLEQIFMITMKEAIDGSAKDITSGSLSTIKLENLDFERKNSKKTFKINAVNQDHDLSTPENAHKSISVSDPETKPKSSKLSIIKSENESNDNNFNNIVARMEIVSKQMVENGASANGAKKMLLIKEMFFKHKFDIPPRENLTRMKVMMKRIQTKVSTELFKKFELEYKNERMRRYRALKNNIDKHNIYVDIKGKITDNELLNLLAYIQGGSTALVEEILSDMRADSSVSSATATPRKNAKKETEIENVTEITNTENSKADDIVVILEAVAKEKDSSIGEKRPLEELHMNDSGENKKQKSHQEAEVDPSLENM